jgi:hypothetical protein
VVLVGCATAEDPLGVSPLARDASTQATNDGATEDLGIDGTSKADAPADTSKADTAVDTSPVDTGLVDSAIDTGPTDTSTTDTGTTGTADTGALDTGPVGGACTYCTFGSCTLLLEDYGCFLGCLLDGYLDCNYQTGTGACTCL